MSANTEAFDAWIRSSFVEMNTALEEVYFAQPDRAAVEMVGGDIKKQIENDGRGFIVKLVNEGNTDEGFDNAFDLLGNLGLYMASMRRHDYKSRARRPFAAERGFRTWPSHRGVAGRDAAVCNLSPIDA